MFNFEKLIVWQKAVDFADLIYSATRRFPVEEKFGLTSQLRRAAVSVSSNIAEGASRTSKADYARFLELATGSVFECVSEATIASRQDFLDAATHQQIYTSAEELSKMLSALRASVTSSRQLSTKDSQL